MNGSIYCCRLQSTYFPSKCQPSEHIIPEHFSYFFVASVRAFRFYGTLPNSVKCGAPMYKNQPGRIEDFLPGHSSSSVSDKDRKDVSSCTNMCTYCVYQMHLSAVLIRFRDILEGRYE